MTWAVLTHFDHVFIVNQLLYSKNGLRERYIILLPIYCTNGENVSNGFPAGVHLSTCTPPPFHPSRVGTSGTARRRLRMSRPVDHNDIADTRGVSYCGRFSVWNYICTQTECNIFEVQAEQSIWNKSVIHGWMGRGEGTGLYLASPAGRLACSTTRAKTETRNR